MGICESGLETEKEKSNLNKENKKDSNYFCAPISSCDNGNNMLFNNSLSQTKTTIDMSHYNEPQKPQIYQYINKYKNTGLQDTLVKASLVEFKGKNNSLNHSNIINSNINNNNITIYSSRSELTSTSLEGFEEIINDGMINEELIKKTCDKNTIHNYNEFIKQKEYVNKSNNNKIMDYYYKNGLNKNKILKEEDISSGNKKYKKNNSQIIKKRINLY